MADRRTIDLYDGRAGDYAANQTIKGPYKVLEDFISEMPEGGYVLDLGCGPGDAAARMVARGLRVDALDASTGMADVARERYGITVRVGTFDDVSGRAVYDGVWAHFSLLHAKRPDFIRHLGALHRALKPGGRLLLAMKLGQGEGYDGLGRFYTYYDEATLIGLVEAAGFSLLGRKHGASAGFAGVVSDWIILRAGA